jgi:hypothetical protein
VVNPYAGECFRPALIFGREGFERFLQVVHHPSIYGEKARVVLGGMTPGDFPDEAKTATTKAWVEAPFLGDPGMRTAPQTARVGIAARSGEMKPGLPKNHRLKGFQGTITHELAPPLIPETERE